jgi:signal transduction histidine kinase
MVYVQILGVLTAAVSLVALVRALGLTEAQRHGRARDAIVAELDRLAQLPPTPASLRQPPATTYVGMHAGWGLDDSVPEKWRATIAETVAAGVRTGTLATLEAPIGSAVLIAAARPARDGTVWAAVLLQPSAYLRPWKWIVFVLSVATALLVFTALRGAWLFRKNARALHATLIGLGRDLKTPVPRPTVAELTGIADGIGALAADLGTARQAEERLSRELAQKERLAALGRVAAGVAHEVRNPLASIKLRLDLAAASLPEAARGAITAAGDEIMRLDRLVSDLLLVAGKQAGPRRRVDLGELARTRADALAPWSKVKIHVEGQGAALADGDSVARAVDNVLRNAVEASPADETVEVRVAVENGRVELRVEDHGAGVDPARAGELFEPFFTTKSDGTGLGLAISRAIARAHGGDLTYARVGEVTRFSLSLPRES